VCWRMFDPEVEVEISDVEAFVEIVLKYIDVLLEVAGVAEFEITEELTNEIVNEFKWTDEYGRDNVWFETYV